MKLVDEERMREFLRNSLIAEARYLAGQLDSEDLNARRHAVEALAELGPQARLPEVRQALRMRLADDPDAEVREGAASALACLGATEAAPDLITCLEDPNQSLRLTAIEALADLGSEQALPKLERLLADPDPRIRWLAGEAIREIRAVQAGFPAHWEQESIEQEPVEAEEHPPLMRFPEAVRSGWRDDERAHVSACERCQQLVAAQWWIEHPGLWTLVRYLADPAGFPDRRAMELHLERHACRQCKLLRASGLVDALAQLMRAGKSLEGLLSVLAAYLEMPQMATFAAQPVRTRGGPPRREAAPPAAAPGEQPAAEGDLLSMLVNEQGKLEARFEIRDPNWQPLPGLLELAGHHRRQQHGLEFKPLAPGRFGVTLVLDPGPVYQQLGSEVAALAVRPQAGLFEELARLREDPSAQVRQAAEKLCELLSIP